LNIKFNKGVDTEEMVKQQMPSFAETQKSINQFLGIDDEEEEEAPKRKKKKVVRKKKKRSDDV
jgi:hypothetical protein